MSMFLRKFLLYCFSMVLLPTLGPFGPEVPPNFQVQNNFSFHSYIYQMYQPVQYVNSLFKKKAFLWWQEPPKFSPKSLFQSLELSNAYGYTISMVFEKVGILLLFYGFGPSPGTPVSKEHQISKSKINCFSTCSFQIHMPISNINGF